MSYNQLTYLPESISNLSNLTQLYLSGNQLTHLPESISNLSNLTQLDLKGNQLTHLPKSISNLSKLTQLNLWGNPLEIPPIEIFNKGIKAIREYFQQIEQEGEDYLYEAKLLIVGEAGAGKTTLTKKIQNPEYELQEEDSTQGIDVITWNFPHTEERNFRMNIWDFGGQEIYHATHQFFLTKRSLYALVVDTRKEDTDFYYWLNIVELLSDNSPLLIIKNEKQNRKREINQRGLRGQFTNLKETLATNLKDNRGLREILTQVQHYITTLPHVGDKLPKTWKQVREILEQDSRDYISLAEYLQICQENGFTERNHKLQLSGYLHDLGVCLHFQDDSLLKKTVILKPEWGTEAVYKVLDNDRVRNNWGKFTKQDLANIWQSQRYKNARDELLQLMIKFKLCYQIPNIKDTYIAPQLLSENQPDYNWNTSNNLILRYEYKFMPKGIIIQFIVVMHRDICQQKYVWKSGVILEKDQTLGEVIEYYGQREIKIRVVGKHKRDLLNTIIHELDKIHDSYNQRLQYNKLIPCNCQECKLSEEPHFYRFDTLRNFEAKGKNQISCEQSCKMVSVAGLISNYFSVQADRTEEWKELIENKEYQPSSFNLSIPINIRSNDKIGNIMSEKSEDTYNVGQAGAVGKYARSDNNQFSQSEQQQNLAQAAAEIKLLLEQLSQDNPTSTFLEQATVANKAMEQIGNNPSFKQRTIALLKATTVEAFMELIDHPVANVVRSGLEAWRKGE